MRKRKTFTKNCEYCGTQFITKTRSARGCSRSCASKLGRQPHPDTLEIVCTGCSKTFKVSWKDRGKRTCSADCLHTARKLIVSQMMIDDNPMKHQDVAMRMGATRSKRFVTDPLFRETVADYTRKAWADGKYDGVRVGQCEWHDHKKPDGSIVKLQGTWEVKYAIWLDENCIIYETHKRRIPYIDNSGIERSYYPDFHRFDTDEYIDVKNPFYMTEHAEKIECVRRSNPDIKLVILDREALREMGIDV